MDAAAIFDVERMGPTVILTLRQDPDELTFDEMGDDTVEEVVTRLSIGDATNVVIDCHEIERCCSSAISLFVT